MKTLSHHFHFRLLLLAIVWFQSLGLIALETSELTLKKAMSHPDWLGRQPEKAKWSVLGDAVFYKRKQAGSEIRDLYKVALETLETSVVPLSSYHLAAMDQIDYSDDGSLAAYEFSGDIFRVEIPRGELTQITKSSEKDSDPLVLTDNRIAFRSGKTFWVYGSNGGISELATLVCSDDTSEAKDPEDYLAEENHDLIAYNRLMLGNKRDVETRTEALRSENPTRSPKPFYLGNDKSIITTALSPSGSHLLVVLRDQEKPSKDSENDVMPQYVTDDGRIATKSVRSRVGAEEPFSHQLVLLDLERHEQTILSFDELPDVKKDVLRAVKEENYRIRGDAYETTEKMRHVQLIDRDGEDSVKWNDAGDGLLLMLKAYDNKDRWLVSVDLDLESKTLVCEHQLHNDAWINWDFNEFGWINGTSSSFYYLSEEDGYSHLYLKSLNEETATQLTGGKFEVENLAQPRDGGFLYFNANIDHPGIYEVYRIDMDHPSEIETITDLDGFTEFQLSPDGANLLLSHSQQTSPPELYVVVSDPTESSQSEVIQISDTISSEFKSTQLVTPEIIAIDSTHADQPIYARLFLPEAMDANAIANGAESSSSDEKRKAVIFVHGAGYLQNIYYGWSHYFREFLFHSILAQKGYVVLDIDYRASEGYGEKWRTSIYRQMGTPEVEDLVDSVDWLVDNANVDRERVGIYGGSYGGFLTFMAMFTEPDLFKAGAALRPVTMWANYNHGYTSRMLNTPEVDPIAYERSSPIYFAEGLKGNLLINAPMVDDNVFFQDSVLLVQRLIELEKENWEIALFPVEPHGFKQPSSWLDEYRRIYKLFEEM